MFRGVSLLRLPLQPIGDGSVAPGGILGGDIMRRYSIDLRFGAACGTNGMDQCSTMTFWNHLGADIGFLEDAGYAVIRYSLYGGGETTAKGDPDFLGRARAAGAGADAHRVPGLRWCRTISRPTSRSRPCAARSPTPSCARRASISR